MSIKYTGTTWLRTAIPPKKTTPCLDCICLLRNDLKQLWPSDLDDAKLEMQVKMRTLMLVLVGIVVGFLFTIPLF